MATIDDLEFRITASTAGLRGDLARGSQQIDQFANRTSASFNQITRSVRQFASFFGVVLSGRAFVSWIKGALDAKNMTEEQLKATKEAREAIDAMKRASDELARSLGTSLVPAMQAATGAMGALNRQIFGVDSRTSLEKQIDNLELLKRELRELQSLEGQGLATGAEIVEKQRQIDAARRQQRLDKMDAEFARPIPGALQELDVAAIGRRAIPVNRDFMKELQAERLAQNLKRAQELTEEMATDVEKQVEKWHEVQQSFDQGFISSETVERWKDSMLQPIEVTAKRLKVLKDEGSEFAASLGMDFKNAFASWISGADTDFKQLLKNMAAQMATSAVFKILGSAFSGQTTGAGGFLASFFGGQSRATGGDVSGGGLYKVHPGEAFFSPQTDGRVGATAGVTIQQNFYTAAGLPPQWHGELAMVGQRAAAEAYKAITARMGGRR
jgi:hypothetical protein